ncbi:hypothetical protein NW762_011960 [Fusarium torreyae]|uniref:Methyltransferase n=1 Tax=Fusarium torreyae TaxID=1237075 RepID=A0A9W8RS33_9HYPO|nr:hypothetical protein NW762_011960 [Fusarium torreyae]
MRPESPHQHFLLTFLTTPDKSTAQQNALKMVPATENSGQAIDGASQSGLEEKPSAHHPVPQPQGYLEPVAAQAEDDDDGTDSALEDDVQVISVESSRKHWSAANLCSDFADKHPNVEVIGTDLSPMQPAWVPPNVKFELEDATGSWTWPDNHFDIIHIRFLIGAIADWGALFKEAFRCCNTDGFIESGEINPTFCCDDGSIENAPALQTWNTLGIEGGKGFGRSFREVENDVGLLRDAGFVDVQSVEYKVPVGGWTKDEKLRRVGQFLRATIENDLEGYTMMIWHNILNWPKDEYQIFLMDMRKALRNKRVHCYMRVRYVYGRKEKNN